MLGFRSLYISQCAKSFLSEDKTILDVTPEFLDVDSSEIIRCSLENETSYMTWFNNKREEINSTYEARMKAYKNGELTINNVQLSDGGTYECRGLEYTRYYTIYVNGRPAYFC